MKKYLIGLVIISGLMFFLISNDSDSNESNSYKNALRPNPIQLAEFALSSAPTFARCSLVSVT